ncbi:MAG TPA: hypothetical protein VJ255_15500, partial [Candidatus Acidoferrum sp.]|nr:hypothetical protein [Candidatus Acidoferrum sp.]
WRNRRIEGVAVGPSPRMTLSSPRRRGRAACRAVQHLPGVGRYRAARGARKQDDGANGVVYAIPQSQLGDKL